MSFFHVALRFVVFCGFTLRTRITLISIKCLRARHRRDTCSDFCLLHTGFFFSWEEVMETERWWKNIQNCLSLFLKNFCRFFAHCLDRCALSPFPVVFYFTHYLRLDNTEHLFTLFPFISQRAAHYCGVLCFHGMCLSCTCLTACYDASLILQGIVCKI